MEQAAEATATVEAAMEQAVEATATVEVAMEQAAEATATVEVAMEQAAGATATVEVAMDRPQLSVVVGLAALQATPHTPPESVRRCTRRSRICHLRDTVGCSQRSRCTGCFHLRHSTRSWKRTRGSIAASWSSCTSSTA